MSHTITVTKLPDENDDDYEYEIGGTHDSRCESYTPCTKGWHRHPQNDYRQYGYDEWSTKGVPQVHQWISGEWMVPTTGSCGVDWALEYDEPYGLGSISELGTYALEVDWDGDYWTSTVVGPTPAVPEPKEG